MVDHAPDKTENSIMVIIKYRVCIDVRWYGVERV